MDTLWRHANSKQTLFYSLTEANVLTCNENSSFIITFSEMVLSFYSFFFSYCLLFSFCPFWARMLWKIHLDGMAPQLSSLLHSGAWMQAGDLALTPLLVKMHHFYFTCALGFTFSWAGWGSVGENGNSRQEKCPRFSSQCNDFVSLPSSSVIPLVHLWG